MLFDILPQLSDSDGIRIWWRELTQEDMHLLATEEKWEVKETNGEVKFLGMRGKGGGPKSKKKISPHLVCPSRLGKYFQTRMSSLRERKNVEVKLQSL